MRIRAAALLAAVSMLAASDQPYRAALPGYRYQFPRDHFSHPDFQTEWWYYTGNLHTKAGRRFGFELTFFRHAVDRGPKSNVWDVRDVWLAHLALSDIDGNRFFHTERLNRTGAGLAGASEQQARVWNGNWAVHLTETEQTLAAVDLRFRIALTLRPQKPPVIHGVNGVSQKSAGAGHASHYVSFTRLATTGEITVEGETFAVDGLTWMDHEFFTHQLEADQTGWDWFSVQLNDGTELMLFRLRRKDGSVDSYSAGTWIDAQGHARHLTHDDFELTPGATWRSPVTGGVYPIAWTIRVPAISLSLSLTTRLQNQELATKQSNTTAYWEGAIDVSGARQSSPAKGEGYLEMTGYAGPVRMGL